MSDAATPQPRPVPTDEQPVWDLVIADMRARDKAGREKYGTPLQASNGRDPLWDAYQEALDLAVYLRQEIARRESVKRKIRELGSLNALLALVRFIADGEAEARELFDSIVDPLEDNLGGAE